jgi:hypothetical protein
MQDMAFEAVVRKHPHAFSEKAVAQSKKRMASWEDSTTAER